MINKRECGKSWEDMAVKYLSGLGVFVLERNYSIKSGEIDLIYRDGEYICFAEVKGRSGTEYGQPYEAVNLGKRKTICKVSRVYLYRHGYPDSTPVRYDIISILDNEITLYKNAFEFV